MNFPVIPHHEFFDRFFPFDQYGKCWCLYPTDRSFMESTFL
ncbi:MAG: hypothetical protein JNIBNLAF_02196 [Nitrosomonas europaea]|nr:hypothetical protein [Nitrosomonas europaea]